ncbi:MAG: VWA domain-containing protein [Myxococcota bacterium]
MADTQKRLDLKRRSWIVTGLLLGTTVIVGASIRHSAHGSSIILQPQSSSGAGITFSGKLDKTAVMAGSDGTVRLELTMEAEATGIEAPRVPTDLVVILDRSGSMDGRKIEYARAAVHQLIAELDSEDRFALVTYSDNASLTIPLSRATASAQERWHQVVKAIAPGGGTNMSRGMDTALNLIDGSRLPGHMARVILISDGLANQGDSTLAGLRRRALRASRGEYVLSTVGVGNDFNEDLMIALSDAGTGNYYYIRDTIALAQVFKDELGSARETVATGLAVTLDAGSGIQVVDAGGYPLETLNGTAVFRPGTLWAGQKRKVWVTLRVPSSTPRTFSIGDVSLTFNQNGKRVRLALKNLPQIACVQDEDRFYAAVDKDAWGDSIANDEFNEMQWKVGRMVKEGNKDGALREINSFRSRNAPLNVHIGSAAVTRSLAGTAQLEEDVANAFRGPDQAKKQKRLGKVRSQAGYDGRRGGSKR